MKEDVFDALRFFQDHRIDHLTSGNSHCSAGWVQIHCPFCKGARDYHLGINLSSGAVTCWRCGKKGLDSVLRAILGDSSPLIEATKARYRGGAKRAANVRIKRIGGLSVKLPGGVTEEIPVRAANYLVGRGYDPEELQKIWKLSFTGPLSSYKFRIIAPIYHDGKMVSYQGRDYTGNSPLRYKACAKDKEVRDHKKCLYGSWLVKGNRAVVVEGIADAWRLGPGAIALFGIAYTMSQVQLLSQYRVLSLIFDEEPQAQLQQDKLAFALKTLNPSIELKIVQMEGGDPGELHQEEANQLMKELL